MSLTSVELPKLSRVGDMANFSDTVGVGVGVAVAVGVTVDVLVAVWVGVAVGVPLVGEAVGVEVGTVVGPTVPCCTTIALISARASASVPPGAKVPVVGSEYGIIEHRAVDPGVKRELELRGGGAAADASACPHLSSSHRHC